MHLPQNDRRIDQNDDSGQASVEAALLIPLLLFALLLLIQPAIVLYTSMVMQGAAAETCRIVATETSLEEDADAARNYAMRRLAAVPQQDNFHVHEPSCTWNITTTGNDGSNEVSVEISNEIRPLPLFDFGMEALGILNERGNLQLKVSHRLRTKSDWVTNNELGISPEEWIGRWNDS